MKSVFLPLAMALAVVGASAQKADVAVERYQAQQAAIVKQQVETRQLTRGLVAKQANTPNGVVNKIMPDVRVNPLQANSSARLSVRMPHSEPARIAPKASADASLYEGFEGADITDMKWVPDGWSRIDKCQVQATSNWHPDSGTGLFGTKPYAGSYQMSINNPMNAEDSPAEWLITPVFSVKEDHNLCFHLKSAGAWLFDTSFMDFDNWVFTDLVPVSDVIVYVREEDAEEWTKLWSQVDEVLSWETKDLDDLYTDMDGEYFEYNVNMSSYYGKKVQLAFFHQGAFMADNICLDEITVDAMPTPCSYDMPANAYFWSYSSKFMAISNYKIKQYPVFQPLTWKSNYGEDVSFAYWEFRNPESQNDFSMDKDLTVKYHSDYSSEFNTVCNIYNNATLNASAPGYSDGSYQDPECNIIHVGGLPSWIQGTSLYTFTSSMVPFADGFAEMKNADALPMFGYATENNADAYWTRTLLQDAQPGDKLYVDKVLTLYDAPARSAVIDSVVVYAVAKVAPEAKINAYIYAVDEQGTFYLDKPLGMGTCNGSEAYKLYASKDTCETTFTIKLDKPVVVDGAYVIVVDGFRGEGVNYFNPMMSIMPRDDRAMMIMVYETSQGTGMVVRSTSMLATSYGPLKSVFHINPYLTYTYLEPLFEETSEPVEVGNDPKVLSFDSFYPAEKYTVNAPEWCKAEVSGVYDQFKLTLQAENAPEDAVGEVVIECPGERAVIAVKAMPATAINDVTVDDVVKSEYYDVAGRRISQPENGLYIIRNTHSNGAVSAGKVVK